MPDASDGAELPAHRNDSARIGVFPFCCGLGLLLGSLDFVFGLNAGGWERPENGLLIWQAWSVASIFFSLLAGLQVGVMAGLFRILRFNRQKLHIQLFVASIALLSSYSLGTTLISSRNIEPGLLSGLGFLLAVSLLVSILLGSLLGWFQRRETGGAHSGLVRAARLFMAAAPASLLLILALWLGIIGFFELPSGFALPVAASLFLTVWLVFAFLLNLVKGRLLQWGYPLVCLVAWGFPFFLSPTMSTPEPKRIEKAPVGVQRILLITIDTLRADALSCYGDKGTETPNIDRLAAQGVRFEQAISGGSWTLPSFATIMSGLSASTHEVYARDSLLPPGASTLAEQLSDAGYVTAAYGSNPYLRPGRGFERGFGSYRFFPIWIDRIKSPFDTALGAKLLNAARLHLLEDEISSRGLADLAIDWMSAQGDRPFFLWCHFFDPHLPYAPPKEFYPSGEPEARVGYEADMLKAYQTGEFVPTVEEKAWLKELYLAEVRYVDAQVGRIMDQVEQMGAAENTLIVLASDHGEEFWDHDDFEHGHSLYQELIHVPLIVAWPGKIPNATVSRVISLESVLPTILDLADLSAAPGPESPSLFAVDESSAIASPIFSSGILYGPQQEAVIHQGSKLARQLDGSESNLFDLGNDPGELSDLSESRPEQMTELGNLLDEKRKASADARSNLEIQTGQTIELSPDILENLKDLGYL